MELSHEHVIAMLALLVMIVGFIVLYFWRREADLYYARHPEANLMDETARRNKRLAGGLEEIIHRAVMTKVHAAEAARLRVERSVKSTKTRLLSNDALISHVDLIRLEGLTWAEQAGVIGVIVAVFAAGLSVGVALVKAGLI